MFISAISSVIKELKSRLILALSFKGAIGYDIIGDVHGYFSELEALLTKLGYSPDAKGTWQHPHRKAVFVGDMVSRGPDTRGVLNLVISMVENGKGYAILGNHELNAIGYFTKKSNDRPLLEPAPSNKVQLDRVREQYKSEEELMKHIKWLRRLPFFLDLGQFRIVHAFWSNNHKAIIEQSITEGKLSKKLIKEIVKGVSSFANAIKQTTRGIELNLPNDLIIKDTKNIRRTNFRIKWWESPAGKTFRDISFGNRFKLPDYTIPQQILTPFEEYNISQPLLFFGHYCYAKDHLIIAPNLCCVDACLAGGKQLAAYRWNGETSLTYENFVFQDRL